MNRLTFSGSVLNPIYQEYEDLFPQLISEIKETQNITNRIKNKKGIIEDF